MNAISPTELWTTTLINFEISFQITNAAVMVWIYGGGFSSGSAQQSEYNGEPLASVGDVIYVTINYRVATFGFLTTGNWLRIIVIVMIDVECNLKHKNEYKI